jgi:hypothetical protein
MKPVNFYISLLLLTVHSPLTGQWDVQSSGTPNTLGAVCFTGPMRGTAVGALGTIIGTTPGSDEIQWNIYYTS